MKKKTKKIITITVISFLSIATILLITPTIKSKIAQYYNMKAFEDN